jgi:hypothetical protein
MMQRQRSQTQTQEQIQVTLPKRHRAKWSYNEIDKLHREFICKQYTVEVIAREHERTPNAILFKLQSEGLLDKEENDDEELLETENEWSDSESSSVTEDEGYEESDADDTEYSTEEEEEEEEEDEEEELPRSYQIDIVRTYPTNFAVKCLFAYCNAINRLVDAIFDTSHSIYKMVFVK